MQSIGTGRPYCKSYTQLINPSAPAGHLPEGELAAGQEKPAWAVTQGRLWLLQEDNVEYLRYYLLAPAHSAAGGKKSFSFPFSKKENLLILFRGKEFRFPQRR